MIVARRQKANPEDAVARELDRVKFSRGGPMLSEKQLSVMEDLLCINGSLPAEFRAFLLRQNGGDPNLSGFTWHHPKHGDQAANLQTVLGLDPSPTCDPLPGVDCIRMTLKLRDELPAWAIVIANADRDDWLLTFEDGPREGEIWIKYWDEVPATVDEPPNPEAGVYRVAGSFVNFLQLLRGGDG
jgi:hypothetical protein